MAASAGDVERDKAHCFNRDAINKIEACTRLIDDDSLDADTRGLAHAFRCSSNVTLRRMDQARGDCFIARHLAPEAPQSHFASYMFSFYDGDKTAAEIHLSNFRRALDRQRDRERELQGRRSENPALEDARDRCLSEGADLRPERVILACDRFRGLTDFDDERAFASAVSCHFRSRLGFLALANRDCNRAFQNASSSSYAYFARGYLRVLQGNFRDALTDFDRAAATGALPREQTRLMYLSRTFAGRILWEHARRSHSEAKDTDENEENEENEVAGADLQRHWEAMQRRDAEEWLIAERALTRLKRETEDPLDSRSEDQLCSAESLSRPRERACLARALKRTPGNPSLLIRLANLHAQSGNHQAAVDLWSRLIVAAPENAELYTARCRQRFVWGKQLRSALADCNEAVGKSPENYVPLELRGSVYLRLKDFDAAIADYDAALALNPMCNRCLYGRGLALLAQGSDAAHEADIAGARKLNPEIEREFWNPYAVQ